MGCGGLSRAYSVQNSRWQAILRSSPEKRRETSPPRIPRDSLSERIECWVYPLDFVQLAPSSETVVFGFAYDSVSSSVTTFTHLGSP